MKRRVTLILCLIITATMMAGPVSLEQAQQQAQQFLSQHSARHTAGLRLAKQQPKVEQVLSSAADACYYVFNVGTDQGFVIVSGDDRSPAILGYADNGTFSDQDMPDNMRAWLQGYEDQMRWMDEHDYHLASAPRKTTRATILPLITTTWDQGDPYNRLCPSFFTGNRSVTGCVATAMAQVMYYHRWPQTSTANIPAYDCATSWGEYGKIHIDEHAATTFEWDNMRSSYDGATGDSYTAQCNAVATLMAYCGASVKMNYSDSYNGGSSASTTTAAAALRTYFDYDASTHIIDRTSYTSSEWDDLIYEEINAGRPVLYSGQSTGGGHAFVIDGYDTDNYFHVNWGWNGNNNGYFLLSVLNPYNNSGSGASSSKDGYSYQQDAIVGIQPQKDGTSSPSLTCTAFSATQTSTSPRYSNGFAIPLKYHYENVSGYEATFDIAFGLFSTDGNIAETFIVGSNCELGHNSYNEGSGQYPFGASVPNGNYIIELLYKLSGTEQWLKMNDADLYAVSATISTNEMTFTNATPLTTILTGTDIMANGTMQPNNVISLNTTITNSGNSLFNDYLYLFVDGTKSAGKIFEAGSGASELFSIEYIPATAGQKSLKICSDTEGTTVVAQGQVEISAESTSSTELTISGEIVNSNSTNEILGNQMQLKITISNSSDKDYNGQIELLDWVWSGNSLSGQNPVTKSLVVAKGETTIVTHTFENLSIGSYHSFRLRYLQGDDWTVTIPGNYDNDKHVVVAAYGIYKSDGSYTFTKATDNFSVPTDAIMVDMRNCSVNSIIPNDNPNTLYLFDEDATTPSNLSGKNVVKGSVAENITLTDGYQFYTPINFSATSISYQRKFTTGYKPGAYGWDAIMLPFDVSNVTADGVEIDWFRSSADKGKRFWVMQFDGDNGSNAIFIQAPTMKAYTPYIVAVPGNYYGTEYDLTGKQIVFSGTNASVRQNSEAKTIVSGSSIKFIGTQTASTLSDIYKLDNEGHQFVKGSHYIASFHGYLVNNSSSSSSSANSIGISIGGNATGILQLDSDAKRTNTIYNLNGMPINGSVNQLPSGIYIINGKKIIK